MSWLSVKDYAVKNRITEAAVRKKIKRKTILSKKENGKIMVYELSEEQKKIQSDTDNVIYQDEIKRKMKLQNDLKSEKVKNIRIDIELKKQKNRLYIEQQRRVFANDVFECFTSAFENLKSTLVQCKLNKEQNQKISCCFRDCLLKFKNNLIQHLHKKDADVEKGVEDDETIV